VAVAAILVNSLHAVDREPLRYGASWDYSLGDFVGGDSIDSATARLSDDPLLRDVSFVFSSGPVQLPDVPAFWVLSFESLRGDVGPVIVEGRAPEADDEVAVGTATLAALGKGVGPGKGMIVTESTRLQIDPAASPVVLARTDPAVDPVETSRRLAASYGSLTVPTPQSDISNLVLISNSPWLIALLVAALVTAALGHALIGLVRRGQRDAGVLCALGFTFSQVASAVCWHTTGLIMLATVIGLPLGVIAGRWGWAALARSIGLTSAPVVPLLAPLLAAGAALIIANLVAVIPSWWLTRRNVAASLRAE